MCFLRHLDEISAFKMLDNALKHKDKIIGVEYTSKKGKKIVDSIKIPMGRKIRQSIEIEKRRARLKAERERRQSEAKERYGS